MSVFELRKYIEELIPAWVLLIPFVLVGFLWVSLKAALIFRKIKK